jgi:hypothetical protein
MNQYYFVLLLLLQYNLVNSNIKKYTIQHFNIHQININIKTNYLKVRNNYLKYITKQPIFKKLHKSYNSMMSKYYDCVFYYSSLTDEEKEFIENIISLCY